MHILPSKTVSAIALAAILNSTVLLPAAQAALVETDAVYSRQQAALSPAHKEIDTFLAQEDIMQQLQQWGVSPEEARARASALPADEAERVSQQIAELPAGQGAGAVVGAVVFVFLVLLITDILGFTKVFPFTRSVR